MKMFMPFLTIFAFVITTFFSGMVMAAPSLTSPAIKKPAPYTVGCVLPLTGKHSVSGARTLDAIILAMRFFGSDNKNPFRLIIEDSKGSPAAARLAVTKLAREHQVICVLGPLSGAESKEAAKEAQKLNVPIITLTQRDDLTNTGSYVFRHFLSARGQIRALVEYAMVDLGMSRFAVLQPEDTYGREMSGFFQTEVSKRKGTITSIQPYEKGQTDFGDAIKAIAGIKPSAKTKKSFTMMSEEEEYKPTVNFDAVFIPDNYSSLGLISSQLAFYNVRGVRLLGTSLWNHPSDDKKMASSQDKPQVGGLQEGIIFVDGFSANSLNAEAGQFADLYFTAYDRSPGTLEAMAYDAAGIIAKIITDYRIDTRDAFRERIMTLRGYRGATGKTFFENSRDARKELLILTFRDGQIVQIKSTSSYEED